MCRAWDNSHSCMRCKPRNLQVQVSEVFSLLHPSWASSCLVPWRCWNRASHTSWSCTLGDPGNSDSRMPYTSTLGLQSYPCQSYPCLVWACLPWACLARTFLANLSMTDLAVLAGSFSCCRKSGSHNSSCHNQDKSNPPVFVAPGTCACCKLFGHHNYCSRIFRKSTLHPDRCWLLWQVGSLRCSAAL